MQTAVFAETHNKHYCLSPQTAAAEKVKEIFCAPYNNVRRGGQTAARESLKQTIKKKLINAEERDWMHFSH